MGLEGRTTGRIVQRIVLVRHGETEGESSIRFHGRGDVPLSPHGVAQLEEAAGRLHVWFGPEPGELVVASPLERSWRGAWIVGSGRRVRVFRDFREVDFGRWEGLTAAEIRALDPEIHERWQSDEDDFAYPEGESRPAFRARVGGALTELLAAPEPTALCVLHKGVIREIVRRLVGDGVLERDRPALGEVIVLSRGDRFQLLEGPWNQ